jgi:Co/Zn/Cd efflux system component
MDCAAEERLVRMALEDRASVRRIDVDLTARTVAVIHDGELEAIERALADLGLGSARGESVPVEGAPAAEGADGAAEASRQRRLLWAVLAINAGFFVIEMTTGLLSRSMGLVADSLDMLADALVYGMSLLAVGGSATRKKRIAAFAGYLQLALAGIGFAEVVRRVLGAEALPDFRAMIVVALLALAANVASLWLLQRSRSREAHMRATMIFTSNDIVINLGVVAAGILVLATGSGLPDLIVGAAVFVIVMRGAVRILRLAR